MKTGMVPRNLWLDPKFKAQKANGKLVMMYLLTCPLGNSAHLFRIGPDDIAIGCGIGKGQVRDLLGQLEGAGFITYDFAQEIVWLEGQMVAELGPVLKAKDNRIKFLQKLADELPDCRIRSEFLTRYGNVYHLKFKPPSKGPSDPLRSQGQGQYQGQVSRQRVNSRKDSNSEVATTLSRPSLRAVEGGQ